MDDGFLGVLGVVAAILVGVARVAYFIYATIITACGFRFLVSQKYRDELGKKSMPVIQSVYEGTVLAIVVLGVLCIGVAAVFLTSSQRSEEPEPNHTTQH